MNNYFLIVLALLIITQYIIHEQNIYLNGEEHNLIFKIKFKDKILYTLKDVEWLYVLSLIPYINKLLIVVYIYVITEDMINNIINVE